MVSGKMFGVTAAILFGAAPAFSAVVNPSFEDVKLSPWETTGWVEAFGLFQNTVAPTDGNYQLVAHTNRFAEDRDKKIKLELYNVPNVPDEKQKPLFNIIRRDRNAAKERESTKTLQKKSQQGVATKIAADFFGIDLSILAPESQLFDSSGFKQTFTVDETSKLTFDWALAHRTSEVTGDDIAFVVLDGEVYLLTNLFDIAFAQWAKRSFIVTDWLTFEELPELEAGEHTIAFGVINVDSGTGRTALIVDNIQINPVEEVGVPEPATLGLIAAAATFTLTRRRR